MEIQANFPKYRAHIIFLTMRKVTRYNLNFLHFRLNFLQTMAQNFCLIPFHRRNLQLKR